MTALPNLARKLAAGELTSRQLIEDCLTAIEVPDGEGARAFLKVNADAARAEADRWDKRRKNGQEVPPYAGIPMALKDLFDVEGEVTTAGSTVLRAAEAATVDAPCIKRLRTAGFIFIGRTNMVEFAYGGIGTNPHYGTPLSIYDRATGRVPGGSSSGSAVAVADGMASISMGTDTGGSCRIPAAFNRLTGYKPSASRIPTTGVYPLSTSLDSVGPIGHTVDCCAAVDAVLAGDWSGTPEKINANTLRLGVLKNFVLENLDTAVAAAYEKTLTTLSKAGFMLVDVEVPAVNDIPAVNPKGGLAAAEAWTHHHHRIEAEGDKYDPRVATRMSAGATQSAVDYIEIQTARRRMIADAHTITREFDALILPSVAVLPPTFTDIENDDDYVRLNILVLRNTSVANFLDRCAISLPASGPDDAPVGIMLMGEHGSDARLFSIAKSVETALEAAR